MTALYRREKTGKGGIAQSSLLQNGLWANACFVQSRLCGEHVPLRAAARAGAQSARQPLSLPRRALVHHGAVQRAAAAARLPDGDRLHAPGR